eukprot:TRINITY_DN46887_c0_g1_i1.p1 TRINITY_DN46887_c0_g1~~TRINITY_DN46887_c0_g1_i1.p1  ORF type:complete len:460 (+),score=127.86 TRINITY_DN46887_c0_g1_i1:50-1429(+)
MTRLYVCLAAAAAAAAAPTDTVQRREKGAALRVPMPDELRDLPRSKGGGAVGAWGCNWGNGLNNQRQMLQMSIVVAVLLGRPLAMQNYTVNSHDPVAYRLADLYDLPKLRSALRPLEVFVVDRDSPGPLADAADFEMSDGQDEPVDLKTVAALLPRGPTRLTSRNCWGSVQWRLRSSSAGVRQWADAVLRASMAGAPGLVKTAKQLMVSMRSRLSRSTRSQRTPTLHSVHLRTVGRTDNLEFPYPPVLRCCREQLSPMPCRVMPGGCFNQSAMRVTDLVNTSFHDYAWVFQRMVHSGVVRPGDAVFIASNSHSDPRVRRFVKAMSELGVTTFLGSKAAAAGDRTAERGLRQSATGPVLIGLLDLLVAAGVGGRFVAAGGSSFSEHILDLRRWRKAKTAGREWTDFQANWADIVTCISPPKRELSDKRCVSRPGKKGKKCTWLSKPVDRDREVRQRCKDE